MPVILSREIMTSTIGSLFNIDNISCCRRYLISVLHICRLLYILYAFVKNCCCIPDSIQGRIHSPAFYFSSLLCSPSLRISFHRSASLLFASFISSRLPHRLSPHLPSCCLYLSNRHQEGQQNIFVWLSETSASESSPQSSQISMFCMRHLKSFVLARRNTSANYNDDNYVEANIYRLDL